MRVLQTNPDDKELMLLKIGQYYTSYNMDSASLFLDHSLAVSVEKNNEQVEADALKAKGELYCVYGFYDKGIKYMIKALKKIQSNKRLPECQLHFKQFGHFTHIYFTV